MAFFLGVMFLVPNTFYKSCRFVVIVAITQYWGMALAQIGIEPPVASVPISGPTLEATTSWLSEKIDMDQVAGRTKKTEFNGCELKRTNRSSSYLVITTADLTQLDANTINLVDLVQGNGERPGFTRVWVWTLGKRAMVVVNDRYLDGPVANPTSEKDPSLVTKSEAYVLFYFRERELAERVKNAFQHAIKLCIRQAADRKAAEPPKPKEIF